MIYVFLGPSGAGKGLYSKTLEDMKIPRAISSTTREKRANEKEGINYFFKEENEETKKEMLQSPAYDDKHRNVWYYTSKEQFEKSKNVFCEMSKKGVNDLRKYFGKWNVKVIYVYASPEETYKRIKNRDGEEYALRRSAANLKEESFKDIDLADLVLINHNDSNISLNQEILKTFIANFND